MSEFVSPKRSTRDFRLFHHEPKVRRCAMAFREHLKSEWDVISPNEALRSSTENLLGISKNASTLLAGLNIKTVFVTSRLWKIRAKLALVFGAGFSSGAARRRLHMSPHSLPWLCIALTLIPFTCPSSGHAQF